MTNTRPKITTGKKEHSSSRVRIDPRGYLMLTPKGFEFVKKWFHAEGHVPPHLARRYHLLLRMVSFKGVMNIRLALRSGYHQMIISEVVSNKYAVLTQTLRNPPKQVQRCIKEMVGEPPKEIYV